MTEYLLITDDTNFSAKLKTIFNTKIRISSDIKELKDNFKEKTVIIDGDFKNPPETNTCIKLLAKMNKPLIFAFEKLSGLEVVEILNNGAFSVIFKSYTDDKIRSEIRKADNSSAYLKKINTISEEDKKLRKFIKLLNNLTSDNDINKIISSVLKGIMDMFRINNTAFYLKKRKKLVQMTVIGSEYGKNLPETINPADKKEQWISKVSRTKSPLIIKDEKSETLISGTVILPLRIKGKFTGMIVCDFSDKTAPFTKSEKTFLQIFMEQTSLAIENARLYWDVLKAREKIINQEKKALLGQMIVSLNHEINNPLSIISMEAQLLQKKINLKNKSVDGRLENIESNIERIKVILEKISSIDLDENHTIEYVNGQNMLNLYNEN